LMATKVIERCTEPVEV